MTRPIPLPLRPITLPLRAIVLILRPIASLAVLGILACHGPAPEPPDPSAGQAASTPVRWIKPQHPSEHLTLFAMPAVAVAAADARQAVALSTRAQVETVFVRAGDRVLAGAPLVDVRVPEWVQAAAQRQATQTRLAAQQKYLASLKSLRGEGLARTGDVFQIETQVAELQALRAEAESRLRGAGLDDAAVSELIAKGHLTLRARQDGLVRQVTAVAGATVEPGQPPLLVVESPRAVRIEVHLHQPLPQGGTWVFRQTSGVDLPLQPTPVAQSADAEDGSQIMWFDAASPDQTLPAGTRGQLVLGHVADDIWAIPVAALINAQGAPQVIVSGDSGGRAVSVQVVGMAGSIALVRGLSADLRIADPADRALPAAGATP